MIIEIDSPPAVDLGQLTDQLADNLDELAKQVIKNPGYQEPGRSSRLIILDDSGKEGLGLKQFAQTIGRVYLGEEISNSSLTALSVITDQEEFDRNTRTDKVATSWHQDFDPTETGLYYPPLGLRKIVISQITGTDFAVGSLKFRDPIQITEDNYSGRAAALKLGPVILGTDRVLVKSEPDPEGGTIHRAKPGHVYIIPRTSVHRSPLNMPNGRILFQIEAPRFKV